MEVVSLIAQIIDKVITILCFALFARVILSYITDLRSNKFVLLLYDLTEPLLKPFRRIQFGGPTMTFDFSPLAAILVLYIIQVFCVRPFIV